MANALTAAINNDVNDFLPFPKLHSLTFLKQNKDYTYKAQSISFLLCRKVPIIVIFLPIIFDLIDN